MNRPLKSIAQRASHPRSISSFQTNILRQQQQYHAGIQFSGRTLMTLAFDHDEREFPSRQNSSLHQCRHYTATTITTSAQLADDEYYDPTFVSSNNNHNYGKTTQFIASSASNSKLNSLNDNQSNITYRSNHNSISGDRLIRDLHPSMLENSIVNNQSEMAKKLKSYTSLQQALMYRGEGGDFSVQGPRFSQFLLQDVLKIVRQFDTTTDEPLFTQRELLSIMHTLILPRSEMTIPSHALKALLELAVITVSRLNPKGRATATSSTTNISTKTSLLTLDDAICCQELVRKLLAIEIYHTSHDKHHHQKDWNKSLLILMNLTLNLYSTVASHLRDPLASRQVVQMAEKLLLESAASSQQYHYQQQQQRDTEHGPERLQLNPDVISFNTVIMAWGKSVQTSHLQKRKNRHSKAAQEAGVAAAERAQAILTLLLDLSIDESNLKPTETSYNVALGAWANASPHSKIATREAMQLLEEMVEKHRGSESFHPSPTAATLVTLSKVLCSCPANDIHSNIGKLLQYRDEFQMNPSDIILNNALLTAYARSARSASSVHDNLEACRHMIDFFDMELQKQHQPDRVSFLMALDALQDCARRIVLSKEHGYKKELSDFVLPTSRRLLRAAVEANVADTRMHNDVLGAHACNADEAQILFDHHPAADYMAYVRLLEAYEQTAKLQSIQNGNTVTTSKSITELAKRAEAILYKLENLSESVPSLRPHTNLYNAAILTHLERGSLEGAESAARVLNHLQQKYKHRLQEFHEKASETRICERPNTTSFVSVMAGYLKHGQSIEDVAKVENLWGAMTDLQLARTQVPPSMTKKVAPVQSNIIAMNIMLRMYTKYCNEQPLFLKQAEQLALERMIPEPDEFSFTILCQAYGNAIKNNNINDSAPRRKDILERTVKLLQVARTQIKQPNLRFFNAVLHTLAQCKSEEAALVAETLLLEHMSSLKPDSYSYAAVVTAWTNLNSSKASERAKDILLSSAAEGSVDAFCFNTVLASFARLGDVDQAEQLVEEMKSRRIQPTAFTYQSLALGQSGNVCKTPSSNQKDSSYDHLQKSISQYLSTFREEDKPGPRTFTHVLSKLFRIDGSHEKMLTVINQKLDLASSGNSKTEYCPIKFDTDVVIKKLASVGYIDPAIDLIERLEDHGCKISTKAYNSILAAYARGGKGKKYEQFEAAEKTMELLNQMKKPDAGSYAACIAAWLNCASTSSNDNVQLQYDEEAESLLTRMNNTLERGADGDEHNVSRAYHLALRTCLMKCNDAVESDDKTESLQRGARMFAEMIRHECTTHSSYACMLQLTRHIQPQSRQQLVRAKLVEECKASGQLSSSVLKTLLSKFSRSEVSNLLQVSQKKISFQDLPSEWSANIRQHE